MTDFWKGFQLGLLFGMVLMFAIIYVAYNIGSAT